MPPLPPDVEDFRAAVADIRPGSDLRVEAPYRAGTVWWLELDTLPLTWVPDRGFGFFAPEGEVPEAWVVDAREAAGRAVGASRRPA